MKLFNTLGRKLETFKPFDRGRVKIYTCGPTVYSSPHIGNYAAYVYWDLLVRALIVNGYGVERVLNLTDVGHLSSDGDEGEDKLEKGARQSGKTVWEVAEFYTAEFLAGWRELELIAPTKIAKATDYIIYDMKLVDILTRKGFTYETRDGIYFDTSKFPHYADFAKLDLEHLKAGARIEFSGEKKNPSDFAVWKFIQPGENHAMRWDYQGRPGYPGWHLECSTIIHEELGETIDIHAGGIDHIPVHHTNEIAQSEAAFDKELAKYWLHCNHLLSDGQKISKSLGNGYSLHDIISRGFSPLDFKMWVLQGHYRSERDFNFDDLEAARVRRLSWRNRVARARENTAQSVDSIMVENPTMNGGSLLEHMNGRSLLNSHAAIEEIIAAASDDLNSAKAFALIDNAELDFAGWQIIDGLFGLGLIKDAPELNDAQKQLLAQREQARAEKDYAKSDELRDLLATQNIAVLDTAEGQVWQYSR